MRVVPYSLPLADPLATAAGSIDRREGFVVHLAAGETGVDEPGVGEAAPLPGWTEFPGACRDALVAVADGLDGAGPDDTVDGAGTDGPTDGAGADDALDEATSDGTVDVLAGRPAARHALSLALTDARARALEEPLYRSLDGPARVDRVPVNAVLGDDDTEGTAEAAREVVDRGFEALKVKVGARPLADDVARVAAVRDVVGDGPELRLDANGAWSQEVAERALDELAAHDVAFVEQPLAAADLDGHAALRGATEVGVAVDESVAADGLDAILERAVADVAILKPMVLGGPDRATEAAARARAADVEPVVTTTVDAVHARTAAVHVAATLGDVPACGLATADLLVDDLADDPAPVEAGSIRVPQGPGNLGDERRGPGHFGGGG